MFVHRARAFFVPASLLSRSEAAQASPTLQELAIAVLGEDRVHHVIEAVGGGRILGSTGEDGPTDEDYPAGVALTFLGGDAGLDAAHLVAEGGNLLPLKGLQLLALPALPAVISFRL